MDKAKEVNKYISSAPKEVQGKLKELRAAIMSSATKATEKMSYGMPYYHHKGRLAYFRHWKAHIGLYLMPPIVEIFKKELSAHECSKATIRFPLDKKLPVALIKKLVKAGVKINDTKARNKT